MKKILTFVLVCFFTTPQFILAYKTGEFYFWPHKDKTAEFKINDSLQKNQCYFNKKNTFTSGELVAVISNGKIYAGKILTRHFAGYLIKTTKEKISEKLIKALQKADLCHLEAFLQNRKDIILCPAQFIGKIIQK